MRYGVLTTMARLKILFHDNCFDGATSAALFSRFYRAHIDPKADIVFQGKNHGQGHVFGENDSDFDADVNAVVDFRYSSSPRLHWWFDHHVSGFPSPTDEARFRAEKAAGRASHRYFDPTARSCSKFLADQLARDYRWDTSPYRELIHWADLIDGAQFESPRAAVELAEPALRLMTWVENNHDGGLKLTFIDDLVSRPLAEIAADRYVTAALEPVLARHTRSVDVVRARAAYDHGVVTFDVSEDGLDGYNKFIPYYLFPECTYVVGVSQTPTRCKISVGSNPWRPEARTVNIAHLCEKYGGGGHPVVGAVSLKAGELVRAREVAAEIAETLRRAVAEKEGR